MKLRYIESWSTEIELTEDDLFELDLQGKTAEEVADCLSELMDEPDNRLMPNLFRVTECGTWEPKSDTEFYNTEWEALE